MKKLRAYHKFNKEISQLVTFHESTLYAFSETEKLLGFRKDNKLKFDENNVFNYYINKPSQFNLKKNAKVKRRENLNSTIFVRLISILEVFLIDLVRETFTETKVPFMNDNNLDKKKGDKEHNEDGFYIKMSHREILNIKSVSNLYKKIINKECRKLSSGGYKKIKKYYKNQFGIDMSSFSPGEGKMLEYHDRRHLLVHRLGKTDSNFRENYSTTAQTIRISDEYITDCINDFKSFCGLVHTHMAYYITDILLQKKSSKKDVERKVTVKVKLGENIYGMKYFIDSFEFRGQDEFYHFKDILDQQKSVDSNTFEYNLSGTFIQIDCYLDLIKKNSEKFDYKLEISKTEIRPKQKLDEEILQRIRNELPAQPWKKGIHKIIAKRLELSNKKVNIGINKLIRRGVFQQQINEKIMTKNEI